MRSKPRRTTSCPPAARRGTSIIEVIVAIIILSGAVLSLGSHSLTASRGVRANRSRTYGQQIASDRIEALKSVPNYVSLLDSVETARAVEGFPGYTRTTSVVRNLGSASAPTDYLLIGVTVAGPGLASPVAQSTAIASF